MKRMKNIHLGGIIMIKGFGSFISGMMEAIFVRILWGFVIMGIFSAIILIIHKLVGK